DTLRTEADAELDDVYSAEHLRSQQQQIAHRIEHYGRSARVLAFPAHQGTRHLPASGVRMAPRWVAAAAAVGLFVGVGIGMFFDTGKHGAPGSPPLVALPRPPRPQAPAARPLLDLPSAALIDLEAVFLSEVE